MLAVLFLLGGLGLANLYSASYGFALSIDKLPGYFAMRQLLWFVPAIAVFGLCSFVSLDYVKKNIGILTLGALMLLFLPFVPVLGITKNGASRWFGFAGLMLQPSELFKPVIILYLAHILSKKADRLSDVVNGVIPPLLVAFVGVGIVLLQNDFSSALLIGILAVIMFWVANVPLVFFAAFGSIGLPLVSLTVLTSDYRLRRVLAYLAPKLDPSDLSYQVNASLRAIKAGGWWGKGLGQGTLKVRSIPEVQSDFVFASYAEETGFAGILLFTGLWVLLIQRAFVAAFRASDSYRSHIAFGMACYLAIQTLINVMVVSGVAPATGIPLPFFSSGGSSLLSVAAAGGFIYNVSRNGAALDASEGQENHG
ncbi:MAG: putative peptidoglycan glycosyltransferase FtsW [Spirochaetota bacterium]